MKNYIKTGLLMSSFLLFIAACNLEKEVDLNLPEFQPQLVVEVFLEPGKPYRALVLESTSYYEPIGNNLPVIQNATVIITYNGITDTLQPGIYFDVEKLYNYGSSTIVPADYENEFFLEVTDPSGRRLTASTRIAPPVLLDSARFEIPSDTLAFILTFNQDDPSTKNFYRRTIHRSQLISDSLKIDFILTDNITSNGEIVIGGPPIWIPNDTAIISLYHITEAYYNYVDSRESSENANGNPFGQPGVIRSNVTGGIGIFTGFSVVRDTFKYE